MAREKKMLHSKFLNFRYNRKIPDYFSAAGAPWKISAGFYTGFYFSVKNTTSERPSCLNSHSTHEPDAHLQTSPDTGLPGTFS